jgi:hypothetical protein
MLPLYAPAAWFPAGCAVAPTKKYRKPPADTDALVAVADGVKSVPAAELLVVLCRPVQDAIGSVLPPLAIVAGSVNVM